MATWRNRYNYLTSPSTNNTIETTTQLFPTLPASLEGRPVGPAADPAVELTHVDPEIEVAGAGGADTEKLTFGL